MLIAEDSSLTSEYIQETKSMAKMQLYEELQNDSAGYANDSLLLQFKAESDSNAIGQLYNVKEKLNAVSAFDSLSLTLIHLTDSLSYLNIENIRALDSIAAVNTSTNYSVQRDSLIEGLNILQQTRRNLIESHDSIAQIEVSDAITLNDAIAPIELPEENEQAMNDVSARYYLYGIDNISSDYSQILSIAAQCPYAGGKAVYRARGFVKLFNDSIQYDDAGVCLLEGIYKQSSFIDEKEKGDIQIIPNPANDRIEIIFNNSLEGICKIEISDALGAVILKDEMNCKTKKHSINTRNFTIGVYIVKVHHNNVSLKVAKLIIAR